MPGNEMTDHDLLISLNSQIGSIRESIDDLAPVIKALNARQSALELSLGRHSERLSAIRGDVSALKQDKLNRQEIEAVKQDISELKDKSNAWDVINSVGVAFATIVAVIFGRNG